MKKCIRCMEYKEPEEFASAGYVKKKNGEPSTLKICKECKSLDVSIRKYMSQLTKLSPTDAKYPEVKRKLDGLMRTEHLYELRGGKIPQRNVNKREMTMDEIEARNKRLEAIVFGGEGPKVSTVGIEDMSPEVAAFYALSFEDYVANGWTCRYLRDTILRQFEADYKQSTGKGVMSAELRTFDRKLDEYKEWLQEHGYDEQWTRTHIDDVCDEAAAEAAARNRDREARESQASLFYRGGITFAATKIPKRNAQD